MLKVALVGRPNVGKSTLFNRLSEKRISIVDDSPGVTIDRIETVIDWAGNQFTLVDMCGFELSEDIIKEKSIEQFYKSMEDADLFLLIVDGLTGLHPLDEIIAKILIKKGLNTIVVINKIDNSERETVVSEFYKMGFEELVPISANHGKNINTLLDCITAFDSKYLEDNSIKQQSQDDTIKIVVMGKPNVGKSSLINKWLGEERIVVTEIPGTTRDSIDVSFEYKNSKFILVDTAGIRKRSVMFKDRIDRFSYYRSYDSMKKADIALVLIDAQAGLTDRDIKLIADVFHYNRPVVLAINKCDISKNVDKLKKDLGKQILERLYFLHGPKVVFISALEGKNIYKIFKMVKDTYKEYSKRITTAELNNLLQEAQKKHQAPLIRNRKIKFYYITQVSAKPPEFIIFVNFPEAVHQSYLRYLENMIREKYGFKGIPIKLYLKKRV